MPRCLVGIVVVPLLGLWFGCAAAKLSRGPAANARFAELVNAQVFYKGNLHAHTTESDGDAPPQTVARWYRRHGYQFLSITDHDKLTRLKPEGRDFTLINGVEITGRDKAQRPVHVNAICGKSAVHGPKALWDLRKTMTEVIRLSRESGAITLFNHPNFKWAVSREDLLAVEGFEMLEIASGHPNVHDRGDAEHPSAEEIWDALLTKGRRIWGVAVDDAHHYREHKAELHNPGRAWIRVWAPALKPAAICQAIRDGHFYAARGSKITALVVQARNIELAVEDWNPVTDKVDFLGPRGQLLETSTAMPARYTLRGTEGYVRAHVVQGKEREAWTQAYFVRND